MRQWQGKRYWLVGASEGLGREVAFCLSRAGCEVIVSARSEDRLAALVAISRIAQRALAHDRHHTTSAQPDGVFCVYAPV